MQSSQNARIKYIVKNGSQQTINPPTIIAKVLAAFVSMRNRFAWTFKIRFPTPLIVLLPPLMLLLLSFVDVALFVTEFDTLASVDASECGRLASSTFVGRHKNDSMCSFRFNVICIMCKIGLLLVNSAAPSQSSTFNSSQRFECGFGIVPRRRRSVADIDFMLFDGFKWFSVIGGDTRGTLFERRPRCMRNVSRVSSNRFFFEEPENSTNL